MNETPQGMQLQPLEVDDFSGGMTDYYLGAAGNRYRTADNFLILKYDQKGKLFTRPGSSLYNSTYYQIPAGAQRIGTLKYFNSTLLYQSAKKFYYVNAGWQTLTGPTGNDVFPTGIDTTAVMSLATWNKHLFVANDQFSKVQKIYQDGSAAWKVRTAGNPPLASSPVVTAGGGVGSSYLYRFLYFYTYTVGTRVFETRGPAVEVALASTGVPNINTVAISAIPALANGATDNYDTASSSLKVEIYRTTDGGSNFFKAGSVNNGTTTYNDSMSDATLQNQLPLYTESGAPDYDPPPLCKVMHVAGDLGYYGHIKIGSEIFTNRIMQSVPGIIDAVPGANYADLQDEVVGVSSVRGVPVVMCLDLTYRLDGYFDVFGQGFISPQKIGDIAGCVSSSSLVQTLDGVFWAGNDGFYYTDGYQVLRVSAGITETYKQIITSATRKRRIVGKYDGNKKRVWWTVQSAANATEVDACFVLDLNWGLSDDMPFTTVSGGDSFQPSAIEFVGTQLVRGDSRGYTFLHSDTVYTDPKIDIAAIPSLWTTATIIYNYVSVATNFGSSNTRKWVPSMVVDCKDETNLSLQIVSINDDGRRTGNLKPIRFRGNVTWGDPDIYWGDPDVLWNFQGLIDTRRRFPEAGGLRCEYKQIQLTNAFVAIISSDLLGTCEVDAVAHTATLTNSAAFDWPTDVLDYYIAFASDGYTRTYLVTARTDNVLTFTDSSGTARTVSGSGWVLRGYPRGEVLNLLSYTIQWAALGKTQQPFRNSDTGEPTS